LASRQRSVQTAEKQNRNGLLEISFSLKDKTNKDFKRVDVV